ncbi:uncharacterized protein LOC134281678 [Saccostrea cucullata]|uniref:uncharacterized protein LOC134281678 n=1 Tax=Saccostrea cuccullata TaxID=36930 RepID=UPI002ED631A6
MIVFAGKYMQQRFRRRKTTTKNFVDIPPYDISKHRMHHSNGNLQNSAYYKTETENYSTIKTEVDEIKLSAFSQEEKFDDGVYNKLTLRVTGYEEPIARKQLTRRYSDSSSTYMKSSDFSLRRTEEVHNPFQKHRRFSSLRMKNIHKENTGGEMNRLHTMEAGERNVCLSSTKSEECFPLALDGEYVYDMAKFEERNETVGLNHRLLFLKELSSHLLNQKNNIKKNMEIPE